MHRAGCEEVNYNPVTDGAGKGRWPLAQGPPGPWGSSRRSGHRGRRARPVGARGDTWPLGAATRMGPLCP